MDILKGKILKGKIAHVIHVPSRVRFPDELHILAPRYYSLLNSCVSLLNLEGF